MKLNGWQRLWVVFSTLLVLFSLVLVPLIYVSEGTPLTVNLWLIFVAVAIGWPVAVYAIGFIIAWVIRGFRSL